MKKRFPIIIILLFVFLNAPAQNIGGRHSRKVLETLYCIDHFYLDTVNLDKLVNDALIDLVSNLDPHSSFVPAEQVEELNSSMEGEFEGVGVSFRILRDTLIVEEVIAGGPSEKVGIVSQDRIVAVDGENIAGVGITNNQVFKLLRGSKGSRALLTVKRRGVEQLLDFVVIRDVVPVSTVALAYEPEPGYLYVRLSRFAKNTMEEFIPYLFDRSTPLKGMILDLSGNGGGVLATAVALTDQFLCKDDIVVTTQARDNASQTVRAPSDGMLRNIPLAVIIDENSASASEIVSGALQDNDRAVIIGRKSFGKGLVQQLIPLRDGDELKLTVARYLTPSGRCIQSPYELGKQQEYYEAFLERYNHGESFNRDSVRFDESQLYHTLKSGREIYGGGGIIPDIFIPMDTTARSEFLSELVRTNVLTDFAIAYGTDHRDSLLALYPDYESYRDRFTPEGEPYDRLMECAVDKGLEVPSEMDKPVIDRIYLYVRSVIAQYLYGSKYYYRSVIDSGDYQEFNKAMEVVTNWNRYREDLLLNAR